MNLIFIWMGGLMLLSVSLLNPGYAQSSGEELQRMKGLYQKSAAWDEWLEGSGETMPDFDKLPSIPGLPDPLIMQDGDPVDSTAKWQERRAELMKLLHYYVIGQVPPPPGNVQAVDIVSQKTENMTLQTLTLEFGPEHRAKLHVELFIPEGNGPFPVFITQDNHHRWAMIAASRGYIACVYAGADSRDDTGEFVKVWPDYDWTKLARRAWAASRCIDYLLTLPQTDKTRIALTGHSRNGKLSIIGAALDERITAMISSSSGAGGPCPYRFFSEAEFGEGIELITRNFPDWLHPRLRFFAGREEKLPIDQHELVACIAPRHVLISTAINDSVESIWAVESTYYSARKVYSLLGVEDAIQLRYRPGSHETKAEDIEAFVDWLDTIWDRGGIFTPSKPIYPTYEDCLNRSKTHINPDDYPKQNLTGLLSTSIGEKIDSAEKWQSKKQDILERVQWSLGEKAFQPGHSVGEYGAEPNYRAALLGRNSPPAGIKKESFNFGNNISADLYLPEDAHGQLPAVIWLHPLSNSNGYIPGYRSGSQFHLELVKAGFAVLAYDQIGNGYRLEEAARYYDRYPEASLLGKMIEDARQAVFALQQAPFVDKEQIFVAGYGLGARVGLHAAAMDEGIKGVISIAGFTPLRLSGDDSTGAVERLSTWLPLQPRLGAFVGKEEQIPFDYHEILAAIAPRPVQVIAPAIDGRASQSDLEACITSAREAYGLLGNVDALQLRVVEDYNHLSNRVQQAAIEGLKEMAAKKVEK